MENRRRRSISVIAGAMNLERLVSLSGEGTIFPFYHVVSNLSLPHMKHLYAYPDESQFEKDLDEMLRVFSPISIEAYLEGEAGSGSRRQMVLSFDDGLLECHQIIAPLLRKKGVPAIFFLNNDFIDNKALFFRYRASLLIDYLSKERGALSLAAKYLSVPEGQVGEALMMVTYQQQALLKALSQHIGIDEAAYLNENPLYMSTRQVRDLSNWGFHLGAHSMDHPEFFRMTEEEMVSGVKRSMQDIKERFRIDPATFAFPFTSDGVPEGVIDALLTGGVADVIFGTAGLKRTGKDRFIQRIPMESMDMPALRLLKAEYLYYLLKAPLGRNNYFK
ncbi:MAG: polysaccharide deacetylase family protein [Bacteroidota bacterium]